ncbi:hypothetical protein BD413DRAFT_599195 [Trametes elegans]|nr:hypothetical protein BD413DRAFT_599195 [Trametes elegans]
MAALMHELRRWLAALSAESPLATSSRCAWACSRVPNYKFAALALGNAKFKLFDCLCHFMSASPLGRHCAYQRKYGNPSHRDRSAPTHERSGYMVCMVRMSLQRGIQTPPSCPHAE